MSYKLLLFISLLSLVSCANSKDSSTVNVAVAASSYPALIEIAKQFQQKHSCNITLTQGASGKLATQIENGAPFDIFIAADTAYSKRISKSNLAIKPPKTISKNHLVFWSKQAIHNLPESIQKANTIGIANPSTAPFGKAALELININNSLQKQLRLASSISQVNQYITSQSVDFASTSASSKRMLEKKGFEEGAWVISETALTQEAVLLTDNDISAAFFDFLRSEKAITTFKSLGFE